jgi:hypothetical protein
MRRRHRGRRHLRQIQGHQGHQNQEQSQTPEVGNVNPDIDIKVVVIELLVFTKYITYLVLPLWDEYTHKCDQLAAILYPRLRAVLSTSL